MTTQLQSRFFSPEEYLAFEHESDTKNEYYNGEIYAVAGGTRSHNIIAVNILATIHPQLCKMPCEIYLSNMRLKISVTGLYTYPDVVIVCGKPQFEDADKDILLNPTAIVEVLSKSTEAYDRGTKFEHYRTIESLTDYLLVSQDKTVVEYYVRQANHSWLLTEYKRLEDVIEIQSAQCQLSVEEIYEKVEFDASVTPLRLYPSE